MEITARVEPTPFVGFGWLSTILALPARIRAWMMRNAPPCDDCGAALGTNMDCQACVEERIEINSVP